MPGMIIHEQSPDDSGLLPEGGSGTANALQAEEPIQFISFEVRGNEYGIDIMAVREIKGWTDVTSLPNTPKFVRGVLNLRGLIVPIFDVGARFGLPATVSTGKHVVIIVAIEDRIVGMLVDAVSDILTVTSSEIRPAPDLNSGGEQAFVAGLATIGERMVTLLAYDRLFDLNFDLDTTASIEAHPDAGEQNESA